MTREDAIQQGESLAAEMREFASRLDPSGTFTLPGAAAIELCLRMAEANDAFVAIVKTMPEAA
jgi:hypothetical protein